MFIIFALHSLKTPIDMFYSTVKWEVTKDQSNEGTVAFLAASAAWPGEGSAVGGANQEKRET